MAAELESRKQIWEMFKSGLGVGMGAYKSKNDKGLGIIKDETLISV